MDCNKYKVGVPEGVSGTWRVEKFEVTEQGASLERICTLMHGGRGVPAGHYTRLMRGTGIWETTVMSDTPDEVRDHFQAIYKAMGHCLVNGLGLGVVVQAMLEKPEVTKVTVIENSSDVIGLVGEYYKAKYGDRLEIIMADAFEWKPPKGVRYDCVWHDVWDGICSDNLGDMEKLHRKYGKRAKWQGSWCRELCKMYARQGH